MMALDLIMLVIILLAPQDLCVEAQNKDGCRYVAYHVHTLNQVKNIHYRMKHYKKIFIYS